MIYLAEENIEGRRSVKEFSWIPEAIRFGFLLADETLKNGEHKLFSFVSSPTQSCLPGFIMLGAILRNRFRIDGEKFEKNRHFLRIWELGEGAEFSSQGTRYKVVQLRKGDDNLNFGQHLQADHFRQNPDSLKDLEDFRIVIKKIRTSPRYILNINDSQNYLINDQGNYDALMDEVSDIAGISKISNSHPVINRMSLYLVGPKKKKYAAIYKNNIKISQETDSSGMTLGDFLYLDDFGRKIPDNLFFNGVWLNPGARNQDRNDRIPDEPGLAVFDGSTAWDRWSDSLQHLSKVLIFNRSSSHKRQDRMREILNHIRTNHRFEKSLVLNDHPWGSDYHAIRAFVYQCK